MITLPIKKEWFDMILSGEKKEEYRSITPRYERMFKNAGDVFTCRIRNGYFASSPSAIVTCTCHVGTGKSKWGAEIGKKYFVLSILSVEKE